MSRGERRTLKVKSARSMKNTLRQGCSADIVKDDSISNLKGQKKSESNARVARGNAIYL